MGSVSSINPGLTNLLQTLSSVDSPLRSSQTALTAIENSSPADIVKLSTAATQLQEVSAIFGTPQTTPSSLLNGSSTFNPLEDALTSATSSSASSTASQLTAQPGLLNSAEADALLTTDSTTSASSLVNLLA